MPVVMMVMVRLLATRPLHVPVVMMAMVMPIRPVAQLLFYFDDEKFSLKTANALQSPLQLIPPCPDISYLGQVDLATHPCL